MVLDPSQQGRPPPHPLHLHLASPHSLVADVVGVSLWEGERVREGGRMSRCRGPAPSPFPLRLSPAIPTLPEVVQVVGARQTSQQLQVSVLEEQRGGADEDEEAHAHHHRPGQLHPLHMGATATAAAASSCEFVGRRCRDIAGHSHSHAHQDHQHAQQQPHTWRRAQGEAGVKAAPFPLQVSTAGPEAARGGGGGGGGGGWWAALRRAAGCRHRLVLH